MDSTAYACIVAINTFKIFDNLYNLLHCFLKRIFGVCKLSFCVHYKHTMLEVTYVILYFVSRDES